MWRVLPGSRLGVRPPGEALPVHRDVGRPGAAASLAGLWFPPLALSQGTARGLLSAPTPIFLLFSGGPRSLGGPRDQSQAVYCGFRSAQLCWVEDEGACRGTLRSLWLPELALLARQAGRCRPHAPVTGTLCPGALGPFPASQGVAAPPTAQDAGEQGSAPDRPPLPMFCPAGAPCGGPRARQPLHPRAGLPSGWAWGRLRSALGGCSPRMSSPAFGLQRPQQTPVALPWSRRGPAVLSGSELQPERLGSPGPPPDPPSPCVRCTARLGQGWSC